MGSLFTANFDSNGLCIPHCQSPDGVETYESENIKLWFDGFLTFRHEYQTDAEYAWHQYQKLGAPGITELEGFFRLLISDSDNNSSYFFQDALSSRPTFVYQDGRRAMLSSELSAIRERVAQPMDFDLLGAYQYTRVAHGIKGRLLAKQIRRVRPFAYYSLNDDGVTEHLLPATKKTKVKSLEAAADEIDDIVVRIIEGILSHPRLANLPIELPLTGGRDSRHILSVLLKKGIKPTLRHLRFRNHDYFPVSRIAEHFDLDLETIELDELDWRKVTEKWIKEGAWYHFHQVYLNGTSDVTRQDWVGFDGYLLERFLGFCEKIPRQEDRNYSPVAQRLLFPRAELERQTLDEMKDDVSRVKGPQQFVKGMANAWNRGSHYTGAAFPSFSPHFFAPGAHIACYRYFADTEIELALANSARIPMFLRRYPEMSKMPTDTGKDLYGNKSDVPSDPSAVRQWVAGIFSKNKDPAGASEHAWIRTAPELRRMITTSVQDSALVRDSHFVGWKVRSFLKTHMVGGFCAFSLMTWMTMEVNYRLYCLMHSADEVFDWISSG